MEHNFAVTVARLGSSWDVSTFHDDFSTVDTAVGAVRSLRAESMGAVDDFAASILEELDVEVPDIAEEDFADTEGWPEGDFDILVDVGLSEQVLSVIVDESEWWASEQLQRIAEELGFDDALAKAVG